MPQSEHFELRVEDAAAGVRVDVFLGADERVGSRSTAGKLIAAGAVLIDGRAAKKSDQLAGGELLEVTIDVARGDSGEPAVPFSIVFEDPHLIVVDKPAGLVVHPAPGNRSGTLSQALAGRAAGGDPERPGIVHRLDKETSGLLVVAKSDKVLRALQADLAARKVKREYLALVRGRPESASGTIDAPLGRDRRNSENIAIRQDSDRDAITHFEIAEELPAHTLLKVRLETGRTHQIRVHLAAIGLRVSGDEQYGVAGDLGLTRQFLHACELSFHHPETGELLIFAAPLPAELQSALNAARSGETPV
ncbi:MAG: RluA family pseudouridine synthase [Solirubrobacterales bacterium]